MKTVSCGQAGNTYYIICPEPSESGFFIEVTTGYSLYIPIYGGFGGIEGA
mgnify:CR=1 FL=1|tara:strand:- start:511 stop:660 length:150 start_codon:yes stop_codon:yes gene_type:complete